ncbi:MAG: rane-associated protein [Candidatus Parcubacteria bacterium]|jgi:membrane-associated protein|nr:rane-associated protein [Candidatus Parcubacteria bacterium]
MEMFSILDPHAMIAALGTLGVIAVVFLETGAFFGFFFPGDSLLFTAGFLATAGYVSMPWLLAGAFAAAVIGDSVGYAFGRRIGPAIFTREDSLFFNRKNVSRAQHFYERYGKKTIILARFIPIVRTFAPIVAGIGGMNYKTFLIFNIAGGFLWTWAMLWLGYGLGSLIPDPDRFVLPVIAVIILISITPPLWEIYRRKV